MSKVLVFFVKGCALLLGIAMLIGGGLCSAVLPFIGLTKETSVLTWTAVITFITIGWFIFATRNMSFAEQAKRLLLLIGGLFLLGGGLCATDSQTQTVSGALLLDAAVALSGYVLMRWMLMPKK